MSVNPLQLVQAFFGPSATYTETGGQQDVIQVSNAGSTAATPQQSQINLPLGGTVEALNKNPNGGYNAVVATQEAGHNLLEDFNNIIPFANVDVGSFVTSGSPIGSPLPVGDTGPGGVVLQPIQFGVYASALNAVQGGPTYESPLAFLASAGPDILQQQQSQQSTGAPNLSAPIAGITGAIGQGVTGALPAPLQSAGSAVGGISGLIADLPKALAILAIVVVIIGLLFFLLKDLETSSVRSVAGGAANG